MNLILLSLVPAILSIITLPWIASRRLAGQGSAAFATLGFIFSIPLLLSVYFRNQPVFFMGHWLFCDKLGALFMGLNCFVAMTTGVYAKNHFNHETGTNLYPLIYRFYYTFSHIFTFSMLIIILSNNIALMWIAVELATISSVILIGLYQTPEALEAAWKYLILCGVAIGLALLGTVIVYFAAQAVSGDGQSLLWTSLVIQAPHISPVLLSIAFVFILVGYGTKAGFFPLHNWLPDAYTEGPSALFAILSGLLSNTALLAIFRFKLILSHTSAGTFASHLLILFGTVSFIFAALALLRQRKLKRLFAYSSIEHMGLMGLALGIGTPLAYFAGLFHMCMHTLGKTAAFFSCGAIIQQFQTQSLSRLTGLCSRMPTMGWCLLLSSLAILGLPPSGLFFSELLLLLAVLKTHIWLLPILIIGLSIAFIAIFSKIQHVAFSTHSGKNQPAMHIKQSVWPTMLHLIIILIAGLWIPLKLIQPIVQMLMQGTL